MSNYKGRYLESSKKRMVGAVFNRLTVLEFAGYSNHNHCTWRCQCECGNVTIVNTGSLTSGNTRSCGCFAKEKAKLTHTTHGLSEHPLHFVRNAMQSRCYNENDPNYHHYGGRGISVCSSWLTDFQSFYDWAMSNGYKPGLSIDRINNNGNYEPGNCRWATRHTQAQNTRTTKLSPEIVRELRSDPNANRQSDIINAKKHGVSEHVIYAARKGISWSDID